MCRPTRPSTARPKTVGACIPARAHGKKSRIHLRDTSIAIRHRLGQSPCVDPGALSLQSGRVFESVVAGEDVTQAAVGVAVAGFAELHDLEWWIVAEVGW